MKRYRIDVDRTEYLHCYVDARSSDEALERFYNEDLECELRLLDSETTQIFAREVESGE